MQPLQLLTSQKQVSLFAYMFKIHRPQIKIHKTLLLHMVHNTKIHKFNIRKFENGPFKKYSKIKYCTY